jgi:hypothetical protein
MANYYIPNNINNNNLSSNDPTYQYQTQKIIQGTVRVQSSLYNMNLAALSVYQSPLPSTKVNWNQMSDRREPHKQISTGGGSSYHGSSLRRSQTRERPGATNPGGYGVDIKHNSYDRYLNRLKGPKLKRGVIPPNFGTPIPFNPAFPVYGGKTVKTSIIDKCNCPSIDDSIVYKMIAKSDFSKHYIFYIGDLVYSRITLNTPMVQATIIDIISDIYVIRFSDGTVVNLKYGTFLPYFPCNCETEKTLNSVATQLGASSIGELFGYDNNNDCILLNALTNPHALSFILGLLGTTFPKRQLNMENITG